eukprot:gene6495-42_t
MYVCTVANVQKEKAAALEALDMQSKEFAEEKKVTSALQHRIGQLEALLIEGGHVQTPPTDGNPTLAQRITDDYNSKLDELDKERQVVEEDKAQVDRYKQLLLKQRDIMIALTARLNERDEHILGLQEELDAYDGQHRLMEDALNEKIASALTLQAQVQELSKGKPVNITPVQHVDPTKGMSKDDTSQKLATVETENQKLQSRIEALKWQQNQYSMDVSERLEKCLKRQKELETENSKIKLENKTLQSSSSSPTSGAAAAPDPNVDKLKRQVMRHTKDLKALKTIMESRIKVKVENLGSYIKEVVPNDRRRKLDTEVSSLQFRVERTLTKAAARI